MRIRLGLLVLLLGLVCRADAQTTGALQGFCQQGGVSSTTSGLNSTNKLEGIVPSCTVSVFYTNTSTLVSPLYSDAFGTVSPNPFTASALGSAAPGQWIFYAALGTTVDVTMSGGISPLTYRVPVTLKGLPIGAGGGGGGGSSSPPVFSVQYSTGSGGFGSSPGITINPSTVTLSVAGSGTGVIGPCGATSGNCVYQTVGTSTAGMYVQWPIAVPTLPNSCLAGTVTGTQGTPPLPLIIGSWGTCGLSTNPGFQDGLAASIGTSDTTFNLGGSGYNFGPGYFYVDSEWIYYASIIGSTVTVVPGGRGYFGSAAAGHATNANVFGCTQCISNPGVLPFSPIVGNFTAGTQVQGIGSPFPNDYNGQATAVFNANNNALVVDHGGALHQLANSSGARIVRSQGASAYPLGNEFGAPVYIGAASTAPISDSSFVEQVNVQDQMTAPQGFSAGIAGPLTTIQAPTVGAPFLFTQFSSGSTTWSYVCQGVDSDGNLIPGTTASVVTGAVFSFPAANNILCPLSAGAVHFKVYRTAGGPNLGLVATVNPPYGYAQDTGGTLDGSSPSGSNGDVPRMCNNNGQFCILSGTSGTPPIACTGAQAGWEYHITSATTTPFVLNCVSGAWATAY